MGLATKNLMEGIMSTVKFEKSHNPWIIGLALFSMFFGAGNLIFPLAVGQFAQEHYLIASLGFFMTAVLLPFMGVLVMIMYHGSYNKFFNLFGQTIGFLIILTLLIIWIPLGSAPRCITLSYGATTHYLGSTPLWLFSLLYTSIVFVMTYSKNFIIDLLGRYLTPTLLFFLGGVFIVGLYTANGFSPTDHTATSSFLEGLSEGYNTQDLIAAFFFSASIIGILMHRGESDAAKDDRKALRLALRSGVIGVSLLGLVYLGLLYLGAAHAPILSGLPKDRLLPTLVRMLLGDSLGFFATVSIVLACISTSVALSLVFADFLRFNVCNEKMGHRTALSLTSIVTYFMSLIGFSGISSILSTTMSVAYPFLIFMIVFNSLRLLLITWLKKSQHQIGSKTWIATQTHR